MSSPAWWRDRLLPILGFPGLIALAFLVERTVLRPAAQARSPEQNVAFWKDHVADHPDFAPSQLRLALAYQAARDWDGAASAYARALELDPSSELAAVGRAGVLRSAGREAEAAEQMESFLRVQPDCAICLYNLAASYFALQRIDDAQRAAERFLAQGDYRAPSHYGTKDVQLDALLLAGRIYEAQGRTEQARQTFERALKHAPESSEAAFHAGRLRSFASPAAALDYWRSYRARTPRDARAAIFEARALIDAQRPAEAVQTLGQAREAWREVKENASWRAELDLTLALARFRQGDVEAAHDELEELIARHPQLQRARDLLAEVEQARGSRS